MRTSPAQCPRPPCPRCVGRARCRVTRLGPVTVLVRAYDEALAFSVDALGFTVLEDGPLTGDPGGKRWDLLEPARPES